MDEESGEGKRARDGGEDCRRDGHEEQDGRQEEADEVGHEANPRRIKMTEKRQAINMMCREGLSP